MSYTLDLTQKLTVVKNIWTLTRIDDQNTPLGTIEQARMKLKEQVKCTHPDGSGVWFSIKARSAIELAATYDIFDCTGTSIGTMTKDFGTSFIRSTYRVQTSAGKWTVTETSKAQAIIRRVVGLAVDVPWLLRVQFSILNATGDKVGHVNRAKMKIKDIYEIRVDDDSLDIRIGAAIGVAVDAFMNR